ncbi:MAG: ABC transporter substrate-binding protein [Thermodesulfobacteriota bacterium]
MKASSNWARKWMVWGFLFTFILLAFGLPQAGAFVPLKGDLSKYDPNNQTFPTSGDTIKFAIWDSFTGPNAYIGEAYWALLGFVAQDINSQGGIKVDGKMKKIQIIKVDTQSAPDPAKRALEKAILQDKIVAFSGVAGTHIAKLGQNLAKEYKTIFVNLSAYSDELNFLPDFNEYYFRTCGNSSTSAKSLGVFYKNRPETKFYILAQDYVWGHESTQIFEKTIKEVKPNAKIVGKEYFPLFAKDFAPYLEKVRASGAEVVVTMAWGADNENLIKQSRQLGIKSPLKPDLFIPMASPFLDDSRPLEVVGGPAGRGLVLCVDFELNRKLPNSKKLADMWTNLWKTWKAPYNTPLYQWPRGSWYRNLTGYYWFFQVLQKAGSTNPQNIIKAWEGDTFNAFGWTHYMRPDDHQVVADRPIAELEFPNIWDMPKNAAPGEPIWIPAKDCLPNIDVRLVGRVKTVPKPAAPAKAVTKPVAPPAKKK